MESSQPNQTAEAGSYRELLWIAVPLMLSAGSQSLMHVIDRVFLTWYSQPALAAALPAGILFWSCLSLPFGIASYVNTFVAQYDGAGRPDRVATAVWQGIYFATACGLGIMLAAPFSPQIFAAIGHPPEIAAQETIHFRWLSLGAVPALVHAAMSTFFSGRGQTTTVLAVNLVCVAFNASLDYAFIFGWGPIPSWGIAGAAFTDTLGEILATCIFAGLLFAPSIRRKYAFATTWRFDRGLMGDLLKFGGPSGLQMFIDVAGFTAFMMVIGWIGAQELAATNIAFNLNTLAFIPVIGVGIAVSTLVGQRIGEGRPELAIRSTYRGFQLAGGYMLLCGLLYLSLPDLLLAPYAARANHDDFGKIHETVIVLLRFVALYSFFDAMAIVFGSAVRGAGDTWFAMLLSFASAWLLLVLPTYLTWRYVGPNLIWSWTYCSIYVIFLGVCFLLRFQQGRWRKMNVMHRQPGDGTPRSDSVEALASEDATLATGCQTT